MTNFVNYHKLTIRYPLLIRYSSTERQSDLYEKDRSSQFNRSQEREMSFGRDEKYTNEKTASPRYSPDSLKRQSPIGGMRSTYDKYDANYSVNDRYQSQLNRRDESRYSNRSVASSLKEKPFKEDASVQASFSEVCLILLIFPLQQSMII